MSLPVKGNYAITARFGQTGNYWASGHKGVDFVSDDKKIYSTCEGTVRVVAYDSGGWGNYISVGDAQGRRHLYCHLESVSVKTGDTVDVGTVLGIMGSTGNSTGVHLHYQINSADGTATDPMVYLMSGGDSVYKDDKDIAPWAREAVYAAKESGYLVGDSDGNFRPGDPLTRQEAAVLIMKIEKELKK